MDASEVLAQGAYRPFLKGIFVFVVHAILLLYAISGYLYFQHPELMDWSAWITGSVALLYAILNNPTASRIFGGSALGGYKKLLYANFTSFAVASIISISLVFIIGNAFVHNLLKKWHYVEAIKAMASADNADAIPFATASDLAKTYMLYPHRREVLFILARMNRLIAFDDQVNNFNLFQREFLKNLNKEEIKAKYGNPQSLQRYKAFADPILVLARLEYESGRDVASLREAIELLTKLRNHSSEATALTLILRHELVQKSFEGEELSKQSNTLKKEIKAFFDSIHSVSTKPEPLKTVTSAIYQELLDHYAQITAITSSLNDGKDVASEVTKIYVRILTLRAQVAGASEVAWLEGPGKLSLYHLFRHYSGRQTATTEKIVEKMKKFIDPIKEKVYDVEAFKDFRQQATWETGTALNGIFAGPGMYKKIVDWLKTDW